MYNMYNNFYYIMYNMKILVLVQFWQAMGIIWVAVIFLFILELQASSICMQTLSFDDQRALKNSQF